MRFATSPQPATEIINDPTQPASGTTRTSRPAEPQPQQLDIHRGIYVGTSPITRASGKKS